MNMNAVVSALRVYAISHRSTWIVACTAALALVPVMINVVSCASAQRRQYPYR